MFSSEDDEPLAVIASKAKQEGRGKGRRQKAKKRGRKKGGTSAESSTSDDGESGKKVWRKKKKPALENEFGSDDTPSSDMNDESGENNTCEDTPVTGRDPQSNKGHSVIEEKHEQMLENSDEEHGKVEEESNNSSSGDSEKKTSKEEPDNSGGENAQVDNESDSSLSNGSKKKKPFDKQTKGRKEKKKRTTKRRGENESSGKKGMRKQKEKQDGDALRLIRLKKMVTLAGLRIVYKKFFEDIADNDRLRVKALEKEMERRGLTPPFTMEACRAFKLRKEQQAELAELSKNYIIDIGENQKGRVTRGQRSAALATRRRGGIIFEESSDEDEEELEEREHMKQETQNMFKNLRGIVSDGADSD